MKVALAFVESIYGETEAWSTDTAGDVIVACGSGHLAYIPDHTVTEHGEVTPSLLCSDCGWHVIATLQGFPRAT